MRRSSERVLVAALLLLTGVYAVAEEVTLMTYYPSPRGVYDQLRTMGQTLLAQNSGNVGIGETNPQASLHITSNLPRLAFTDTDDTAPRLNWIVRAKDNAGADSDFFVQNTTDFITVTDRLTITSAGNVGIGTATPAEKPTILNGVVRINNPGAGPGASVTTILGAQLTPDAVLRSVFGTPGNGSTIELIHSLAPFLLLKVEVPGNPAITTTMAANGLTTPSVATDSLSVLSGAADGAVLISDAAGRGTWGNPFGQTNCHWENAPGVGGGACNDPSAANLCPPGFYVAGVRRRVIGGCGSDALNVAIDAHCCSR